MPLHPIPLLLSVMFGLGIWLIYEGLTNPEPWSFQAPRLQGMADFLARAGLREVSPREFLAFSAAAGLVVGLVAWIVLSWIIPALVGGALGTLAPFAYYLRRHDQRRATTQAALADAIAQLCAAVRSGLSVPEGLAGLSRTGPVALRPEFTRLVSDMRLLGFEAALTAFRDRLADPLGDLLVATLALTESTGSRNLSETLEHLARATRAELRVQEEIRALQARNRTTAQIVAAVPVVVLVAVRQVSPGYLAIFDDWWGQGLIALCLLSVVLGFIAMNWLGRIPSEPRVLAR